MLLKNQREDFAQYQTIAGVDEAGRGPLAGPVVVAAVILDHAAPIADLNDSKKLTARKRETLFQQICQQALAYKIISVPPEKIDQINILQATLWGMEEAVLNLDLAPQICLIDGNQLPPRIANISEAIVKGDSKYASIAAASILAKVYRDRIMLQLHATYPQYNFAANKGYPTPQHLQAIRKFGITPSHRRSYKPVQQYTFDF